MNNPASAIVSGENTVSVYHGKYCHEMVYILRCDDWDFDEIYSEDQVYNALKHILYCIDVGYKVKGVSLSKMFQQCFKPIGDAIISLRNFECRVD